jgi:hypothetical protein
MKRLLPLCAISVMTLIALTGCLHPEEKPAPPEVKQATNVEMFQVPGSQGFSEGVIVFDIEREGQILTCTTKQNYNSGVGCVNKAKQ